MKLTELKEMCAKICEHMVLYTGYDCAAAIRAIELPDEDGTVAQVYPADVGIGAVKLPSLPELKWHSFCTKCGKTTALPAKIDNFWCECGYMAGVVQDTKFDADQMRAYALAAIAAQPAPVPDYDHNEGDGLAGRAQQEAPAGTGSVLSDEQIKKVYQDTFNNAPGRMREVPINVPTLVVDFGRAIEAHVMASRPKIPCEPIDKKAMMETWDRWRQYIAEGGKASWPRDQFEAMIEHFEDHIESASQPSAQEVRDAAIEEAVTLAVQWGDARNPEYGGLALRNYAIELLSRKSAPISKQDASQPSAGAAKHSDNILGGAGGPQPTMSQFASKADYEAAARKREPKT